MKKTLLSITTVVISALLLVACGGETLKGPNTYKDPDNPDVTVCEGYIPVPYSITSYSGDTAETLDDAAMQSAWEQINSLVNGQTDAEEIDLNIYEANLDEYKKNGLLFELSYDGDYSIEEYDNLFDAVVFIFDGEDLIYGYRTKTDDGSYEEQIPEYYILRGADYSQQIQSIKTLVFGD